MQGKTLKFDPEYAKWREPFKDQLHVPYFESIPEFREFSDRLTNIALANIPPEPRIIRTKYTCVSHDGAEIEITRFATAEQMAASKTLQPAVLFFHGGGMVIGSVDLFAPAITTLSITSGVQYFAVDYRLAPEHPDPTPVEDCYAGLEWVSTHGAELGVDPSRLAVMGESAGGGLAAGTALLARDRVLDPPLKKQILVYPMLDDRSINASSADALAEFVFFPLYMSKVCWESYVGKDKAGKDEADVSPYAAPGRAKSLEGLPPTYIDVGGLDLFRDECAMYAARLAAANVEVEFHLFPGLPHGFERATEVHGTKMAIEGRMRWVKDL
ncbi:Alpha/Beta hydrolase protein [Annulohypoxylon truncatum]|uniref:Alpha/Beta hydrolase protein n=1 Tax=Annulohypoxylon truncatum TaxID=327061 RepID=UPI002008D81F|nr:Alpha/Beta hydrolase protein [Annulohypoxylon truncatum]KAI1210205.1 Alpha/Beta hydrolase protein [Annulohypoxylon truncatum]